MPNGACEAPARALPVVGRIGSGVEKINGLMNDVARTGPVNLTAA